MNAMPCRGTGGGVGGKILLLVELEALGAGALVPFDFSEHALATSARQSAAMPPFGPKRP
jgi:hypothetical protein